MQYKCNECNDSGSRDKLGTYIDCNACGTAATRRDLNDFVKSLGPTHPEDVALAIHKRALAMAPKQEAREEFPEGWRIVEKATCYALLNGNSVVASLAGPDAKENAAFIARILAAPAAANGAMPELPEGAAGSCEVIIGYETIRGIQGDIVECHEAYSADQMRAYGQACHALGRGAAVREYVENGTFKQPTTANGVLTDTDILTIICKYSSFISVGNYSSTQFDCQTDTLNCVRAILAAAGPDAVLVRALESALAIINNEADPDEYAEPLKAIRAALSGAKGN